MALSKILNASVTDSTLTGAKVASSTITGTNISTATLPNLGRRNIVINGAMQVSQRVGTSSSSANNYDATPDRIRQEAYGGASASFQQVTDAPTGFKNSLKVTCAGTAAPSAGNTLRLMTGLEGQNVAQLAYGTAQAKTSTLSFYVKASETGTYSAALVNIRPSGNITSNVTRSHIKTYTVNSANTWEYKTLTFPGCPDGTWGSSNSDGITIVLDLGSGSNHQGSANTWLTTSDTFASGQVTLGDSNGGTWQITGLQFEVGSQATSFEHRSFGEEMQLCKRYYHRIQGSGKVMITKGHVYDARGGLYSVDFPTQMRAAYAFSHSALSTLQFTYNANAAATPTATGLNESTSLDVGSLYILVGSNVTTAGYACGYTTANGNGYIAFDAEL